jgi:hypothetical protein
MNEDSEQRSVDKQVAKRLYDKGHQIGLMICAAWPAALVIFAPSILNNLLLGGALTILSIAQFLWLPDKVARWLSRPD